jgi:uncharacterized RDD family membrane protein YckC
MNDTSQTTLLRIAAFLADALTISVILIAPASVLSYILAWVGSGSIKAIQFVWWAALAILLVALLLRDGYHRRSPGKRLLGLRLVTPRGEGCGYFRSFVRNLPLLVPVWNLVEAALVVAGKRRTGDRLARTTVMEE